MPDAILKYTVLLIIDRQKALAEPSLGLRNNPAADDIHQVNLVSRDVGF